MELSQSRKVRVCSYIWLFYPHTVPGIKPHTEVLLQISELRQHDLADSHLNLKFMLAEPTSWGERGHLVATGQIQLSKPRSLQLLRNIGEPPSGQLKVNLTGNNLSIASSSGSLWGFDLVQGALVFLARPTREGGPRPNILTEPLLFDLYRSQTDNDRGCDFGRNWNGRRLHQAKHHGIQSSWEEKEGGILEVVAKTRIAPPVLNWALELTTTYRFTRDAVFIRAHAKPTGNLLPRAWGRLGLTTALVGCGRVRWFGRGPGESYRDRKQSQLIGRWEAPADDLITDYEFPQENGNRTDVRWVEFLTEDAKNPLRLLRARYGDWEGASFSVLPYSARDLDEAKHPYELYERKRGDRVVHLDWLHHGLGTGSCGPETLPQYALDAWREYVVEVVLD